MEQLKREARKTMITELTFMDQELAALTNQNSAGAFMDAAKWLIEFAYTKYPPPTFSKRRSEEEILRTRELRFRDATNNALKLLQARYAPDKHAGVASPEWAVIC